MLDEPDTTTSAASESSGGDTQPRKAPRRRATKATSAPAAETAPAAEDAAPAGAGGPAPEGGVSAAGETPGNSQGAGLAGEPATALESDAPTPAKRVRKAPAKKAAPRKRAAKAEGPAAGPATADTADPDTADADAAVEAALAAPGQPVVDTVEDDPAVAQSTSQDTVPQALVEQAAESMSGSDTGQVGQPTTTRRRRPAIAVTFQAPDVIAQAGADDDDPAEPAAPRRRRRAGTDGAVAPSALIPTLLAPDATPAEDEPTPGGSRPPRARKAAAKRTGAAVEAGAQGSEEDEQNLDDGDDEGGDRPRRRRRGRRGRGPRPEGDTESTDEDDTDETAAAEGADTEGDEDEDGAADGTRRRRRRRRSSGGGAGGDSEEDGIPTVVHVRETQAREAREPRQQRVRGASAADEDGVRGITGSTRMAAKRARRQEGRDSGRRRPSVLSEAEFLARREAVERTMVVRQSGERTQIAVLEDDVLVEHYVTKASAQSYAGNVYLGRVQNVLPSMEAAFVDIGKGKNGVLYAGEVNYELAGSGPRKIESVLKSGQEVLVQVSKDPIGHKGARLTAAVSLPGRYLVYVPEGSMTGISRKLPENERTRLKAILKKVVPDDAGVIIRTAAEGASEEEINADVLRLQAQWEDIKAKAAKGGAPKLLHAEPDLVVRVVRDVFNEDFTSLVVQGDSEWQTIRDYVDSVAPDLAPRLSRHTSETDVFTQHRIDEQLAKALDRKVWLPSGGSLVIDRTEAMIVIDVNTGKYVGKGGNLEETVTRNNLEAAEEIARQLRLRDLGGIIVVDFIDMVLESNRDLVVRRLVECLGRDRTKHQVAEVTSLGLVQMTRKRVGQGLLESFSETCEHCNGRGVIVSSTPVDRQPEKDFDDRDDDKAKGRGRRARGGSGGNGSGNGNGNGGGTPAKAVPAVDPEAAKAAAAAVAAIAKASGAGSRASTNGVDRPAEGDTDGADAPLVAETAAAQETALDAVADDTAEQAEPDPGQSDAGRGDPDSTAPRSRNRRRRGGRGAGAPPADAGSGADPDAAPVVEVPTEADAADVVEQAQPADEPAAAVQVVDEAPAPRRRRRATSRPAGPAG